MSHEDYYESERSNRVPLFRRLSFAASAAAGLALLSPGQALADPPDDNTIVAEIIDQDSRTIPEQAPQNQDQALDATAETAIAEDPDRSDTDVIKNGKVTPDAPDRKEPSSRPQPVAAISAGYYIAPEAEFADATEGQDQESSRPEAIESESRTEDPQPPAEQSSGRQEPPVVPAKESVVDEQPPQDKKPPRREEPVGRPAPVAASAAPMPAEIQGGAGQAKTENPAEPVPPPVPTPPTPPPTPVAPPPPPPEDKSWALPNQGRLTSGFGPRWGTNHNGTDIAAPLKTPLYAPKKSTVIEAGPATGYGQWIRLDLGKIDVDNDGELEQVEYRVGHMFETGVLVKAGDVVEKGQQIGEVGNNGKSSGPHAEHVILSDGVKIDPEPVFLNFGVNLRTGEVTPVEPPPPPPPPVEVPPPAPPAGSEIVTVVTTPSSRPAPIAAETGYIAVTASSRPAPVAAYVASNFDVSEPAEVPPTPEESPPQQTEPENGLPAIADLITKDVVSQIVPGAKQAAIDEAYPLIIKAMEEQGLADEQMLIYGFATINSETSGMLPVAEGEGHEGRYAPYYGRGYIQLTWDYNYEAAGKDLGLDLLGNPDLAMQPDIAARIYAWFLKRNESHIREHLNNGQLADARAVVNGGSNGLAKFEEAWNRGMNAISR